MTVRSVSYGAGVQSTALLVLAAQRRIDFDLFLFANVGDDSEHPDSLRYMEQVAVPYAAEHGIELVALHKVKRDGSQETLMGRLTTDGGAASPSIPIRRYAGGPPMARSCTSDFKIKVIARELKRRGATPDAPAIVALGISVDEIERARPGVDERMPVQHRVYPLLDLGLSRSDCKRIIAEAGLPVPGKSACFFCPFHDKHAWANQAREEPDLFKKSCDLEALLNERRDLLGKDHVYLTRFGRPLAESVDVDQGTLDLSLDGCDTGFCFT